MIITDKTPFYARMTIMLVGLYVFISALCLLENILLPILYSILIAILISPLVNFLTNRGVNHIVAISIVLVTVILLFCGMVFLISFQVSRFSEIVPQINEKFQQLLNDLTNWISEFLNISERKVNAIID